MRLLITALLIFIFSPILGFAGSTLECDTDLIDFGMVPQDASLYRKVIFRSTGDHVVRIDSINTYCHCIIIPLEKNELAPGDSMIAFVNLNSARYVGAREWHSRIYTNGNPPQVRIRVKAMIVEDIEKMPFLAVSPHTLNASQFGDIGVRTAQVKLINKSENNIPLTLLNNDDDYYKLNFPGFVAPHDSAIISIEITDDGMIQEFGRTVTFQFVNEKEEKKKYSIPIRRKIFKQNE